MTGAEAGIPTPCELHMADLRKLREDLNVLLEGGASSAIVLMTPSALDQKSALASAEGCPLGPVMAELGRLVAQALIRDLETDGQRPADFAFEDEIAKVMRERVAHLLREGSKEFDQSLLAALGNVG